MGTSLLFNRSMMGCGVPEPAQMPSHANATRGISASARVGTSGADDSRSEPVTARTLINLLCNERHHHERRADEEIEPSRHDLLQGIRRALIGNCGHAHAGDLLELLGEDVLRRADSEVAVIELAWVLLGVLDELA